MEEDFQGAKAQLQPIVKADIACPPKDRVALSNVGTQSSTVVIRDLNTEEITAMSRFK